MKSFGGRVAVVFLYAFGSMIAATLLLALAILLTPLADKARVEANPLPLISVVFGFIILFFPFWYLSVARVASWSVSLFPAKGTTPVSLETLKGQILAMASADSPIRVQEIRPNRFSVEWKYADAKWADLLELEVGQLRKLHRIVVDLDARANKVRAMDYEQTVELSAKAGGALTARASYKAFRGITFVQYDYGQRVGLLYKDGEIKVDNAYRYQFNLAELKNPLVQTVLESGWHYRPVVSFWRWLGG